jgi:hypothetical protein
LTKQIGYLLSLAEQLQANLARLAAATGERPSLGMTGERTEGYQPGWMEFLASLKRMHEAGAGWQPVQTVQ